jgi:hypothetical protein
MRNRLRIRRPNAGVTVGFLALMVALGGTAGAALPGNNQVFTRDIANGQVRHPDIHQGAVRSSEIRDGSVAQPEVGTDAIGADELKDTWINGSGQVVNAGTAGSATATCPAGMQIVSGGFHWDMIVADLSVLSMELNTAAQSVTVQGFNDTAFNRTLSARAYCIPA